MNSLDTQRFNEAVTLANTDKTKAYRQLTDLLNSNPSDPNLLLWLTFTAPTLQQSESHLNALQQADPSNSSLSQAKSWLAGEKARQVVIASPLPIPVLPSFEVSPPNLPNSYNYQPMSSNHQAQPQQQPYNSMINQPPPQVIYVMPPQQLQPPPKPSKLPYWIAIGLSFVLIYFTGETWIEGTVYDRYYGVTAVNTVVGSQEAAMLFKNIKTSYGSGVVATAALIIIFSSLVAIFNVKIFGNGWIISILSFGAIVSALFESSQLMTFAKTVATNSPSALTYRLTSTYLSVVFFGIIIIICGVSVALKERKLDRLAKQVHSY